MKKPKTWRELLGFRIYNLLKDKYMKINKPLDNYSMLLLINKVISRVYES